MSRHHERPSERKHNGLRESFRRLLVGASRRVSSRGTERRVRPAAAEVGQALEPRTLLSATPETGTVSVQVRTDFNNNAAIDTADVPQVAAEVTLEITNRRTGLTRVVATTQTDREGRATFENVRAGSGYSVRVEAAQVGDQVLGRAEVSGSDEAAETFVVRPGRSVAIDGLFTPHDEATRPLPLTGHTQPVTFEAPGLTLVGQMEVAGQNDVRYRILGGGGRDLFTISRSGGKIRVAPNATLPDRPGRYTLRIGATDAGSPSRGAVRTVTIDVREPATLDMPDRRVSLNEHARAGYEITTVASRAAHAPGTFRYEIARGNDDGAFAIDEATGAIRVARSEAIDFETAPVRDLIVRGWQNDVANPALGRARVRVSLRDREELLIASPASFTIGEFSPVGTTIGRLRSQQTGPAVPVQFELVRSNMPGAFAISEDGVVMQTQAVPVDSRRMDFRVAKLDYRVRDASNPSRVSPTVRASVRIDAENHEPRVVPPKLAVAENAANGTVVGTLRVNDPDRITRDARPLFVRSESPEGIAHPIFAVDAYGVVTVKDGALLDHETAPVVEMTVLGLDIAPADGEPGEPVEHTIRIEVTDVNEWPQSMTIELEVDEERPDGTVLFDLSTLDPEGDALNYYTQNIPGSENVYEEKYESYRVNRETGELFVANNQSFYMNYERTPVVRFSVRVSEVATAQGGTINFVLRLRDVIEADDVTATAFDPVREDTPAGTELFTFVPDPAYPGDYEFRLASQFSSSSGESPFTIDPDTGTVSVADTYGLDYESLLTYRRPYLDVHATMTDRATGHEVAVSQRVEIENVFEPPALFDETFTRLDNGTGDVRIASSTATAMFRPELGRTYDVEIVGNADGFVIERQTNREGNEQITLRRPQGLDALRKDQHIIRVRATDQTDASLTREATITIDVLEYAEAVQIRTSLGADVFIDPNALGEFFTVDAFRPIGRGTLTYEIVRSTFHTPDFDNFGNGANEGSVSIDPATGTLSLDRVLDPSEFDTDRFVGDVAVRVTNSLYPHLPQETYINIYRTRS